MKTMIDTKIYNDNWFFGLSTEAKFLFLFLISNESCNLIGCYELPRTILCTYTGIQSKQLDSVLRELHPKVLYVDGWVVIKNYEKYNPMRNPSIEEAKKRQIASLPSKVLSVYTGCVQGVDTLCTGYKETEEVKEEKKVIGGYRGEEKTKMSLDEMTDEQFQQVADKYGVPLSFVRSKHDDMTNWHEKNPRKNRYENYYRALCEWVKRDAITVRKEAYGKPNIAFINPQ